MESSPPAGTFAGANANIYGPAALATNTWSHIAATYDGAALRLYLNGTLVSSQARTGAISTSTNPLQIGGDSIYGQFFQGAIDEVRIYNRALTQAEIQTDMNAPLGNAIIPPTNLTATVISGNQVNLSWTAAQSSLGISSYRVERCQGIGCTTFGFIATTTTTTFSDTDRHGERHVPISCAGGRYRRQHQCLLQCGRGLYRTHDHSPDRGADSDTNPAVRGYGRKPCRGHLVRGRYRWRQRLVGNDHDWRAVHAAEQSPACTR